MKLCEQCHREFDAKRSARFCSAKCRKAANRLLEANRLPGADLEVSRNGQIGPLSVTSDSTKSLDLLGFSHNKTGTDFALKGIVQGIEKCSKSVTDKLFYNAVARGIYDGYSRKDLAKLVTDPETLDSIIIRLQKECIIYGGDHWGLTRYGRSRLNRIQQTPLSDNVKPGMFSRGDSRQNSRRKASQNKKPEL